MLMQMKKQEEIIELDLNKPLRGNMKQDEDYDEEYEMSSPKSKSQKPFITIIE